MQNTTFDALACKDVIEKYVTDEYTKEQMGFFSTTTEKPYSQKGKWAFCDALQKNITHRMADHVINATKRWTWMIT